MDDRSHRNSAPGHPKVDERVSYARLFFLASLALLAAAAWTFWDEFQVRRPWRQIQKRFFNAERRVARAELRRARYRLSKAYLRSLEHKISKLKQRLRALSRSDAGAQARGRVLRDITAVERGRAPVARYWTLKAELKRLETELRSGTRARAVAEARQAVSRAAATLKATETRYTRLKSRLEEADYQVRQARLKGLKSELEAMLERRRHLVDLVAAAELKRNRAAGSHRMWRQELNVHLERLRVVRGQIRRLEAPVVEANRRLKAVRAGSPKIRQFDLRHVRRVDRCPTCHLASARAGFESGDLPPLFRSHPHRATLLGIHPPERFGCTACHGGQGRATLKLHAHAPPEGMLQHKEHHWPTPLRTQGQQQAGCLKCHPGRTDYSTPLRCNQDSDCPTDFFVSLAEGVTKRQALILAKLWRALAIAAWPGRFLSLQADLLEQIVDRGPLRHPRAPSHPSYLMRRAVASLVAAGVVETVSLKCEWAKEARSGVCTDPLGTPPRASMAAELSRGLRLAESLGCIRCHRMSGFEGGEPHGPDLTSVAFKVRPKYLVNFLARPKSLRPHTTMPDFWPEQGSPLDKPGSVTRTRRRQAVAIGSFLVAMSRKPALPLPARGGNPRLGRRLYRKVGCTACHRLRSLSSPDLQGPMKSAPTGHLDPAPDLSDLALKTTRRWLQSWIRNPRALSPGTAMPSLRLSRSEAAHIAEFLMSIRPKTIIAAATEEPRPTDPRLVAEGRRLVRLLGCSACHVTSESRAFSPPGTDLTRFGLKDPSLLDFGHVALEPSAQTWQAWVELKLRHPRIFQYERAKLFMPEFGLSRTEIERLTVVLRSFAPDSNITDRLGHPPIARWRQQAVKLMRRLHCRFCHTYKESGGELAKGFGSAGQPQGVPSLDGLAKRLRPDWLYRYLKKPFQIRPSAWVRMPTFHLTDSQAASLTALLTEESSSFAPAPRKPLPPARAELASFLVEAHGCNRCHGPRSGRTPGDVRAPPFERVAGRLEPSFLKEWLISPARVSAGVNMPNFYEYLPHPSRGKVMQNLLADVHLKRPTSGIGKKWQQLKAKHPYAAALLRSPIHQVRLLTEWLLAKASRPRGDVTQDKTPTKATDRPKPRPRARARARPRAKSEPRPTR